MTSPCGFSKHVSSNERAKCWFFVTFNNILRHIFPENLIEFPQVVQKIWRNYLSILANFHQYSSTFWIFWHYLVTKKLMMSTYNRWGQHFFTFNILWVKKTPPQKFDWLYLYLELVIFQGMGIGFKKKFVLHSFREVKCHQGYTPAISCQVYYVLG